MKKSFVMLALATVSVATVFAVTPATTQQPQQPQANKKEEKPAPVEMKKIAATMDPATKGPTGDKDPMTKKEPTQTTKPKIMLIADEKPATPGMEKKDCPSCGDKKDGQKTPAPAKTPAPKVALA